MCTDICISRISRILKNVLAVHKSNCDCGGAVDCAWLYCSVAEPIAKRNGERGFSRALPVRDDRRPEKDWSRVHYHVAFAANASRVWLWFLDFLEYCSRFLAFLHTNSLLFAIECQTLTTHTLPRSPDNAAKSSAVSPLLHTKIATAASPTVISTRKKSK